MSQEIWVNTFEKISHKYKLFPKRFFFKSSLIVNSYSHVLKNKNKSSKLICSIKNVPMGSEHSGKALGTLLLNGKFLTYNQQRLNFRFRRSTDLAMMNHLLWLCPAYVCCSDSTKIIQSRAANLGYRWLIFFQILEEHTKFWKPKETTCFRCSDQHQACNSTDKHNMRDEVWLQYICYYCRPHCLLSLTLCITSCT